MTTTMNIALKFDSSNMPDDGDPVEADKLPDSNGTIEKESATDGSSNKYGDGLKNLTLAFGESFADFDHTPSRSSNARAAAAAKAVSGSALSKNKESQPHSQGGGGGAAGIPNVVDNCLDFLHTNAPKAADDKGITSVADKLKAMQRTSASAPKAKGGADEDGAEEKETSEDTKKKDETDGDNLDGSSGEAYHEGKRESSGKITRGRSPPRSALPTRGPKERDSSVGKKVFTDLLADDGEDSDDSDMDTSKQMKALLSAHGAMCNGGEDAGGETKREHDRRPGLSPRGRMGLERTRSERSMSRSKSPMKRTQSEDVTAEPIPKPISLARSVSTGSHDLSRSPPPRITRTKSGTECRQAIPRRNKSPLQNLVGLQRSNSGDVSPGGSPARRGLLSKAQSVRNVDGRARSPPRRSDSGLKVPNQGELKRSLSGSNNANSVDDSGSNLNTGALSTARNRSLSRSASRRNLSRDRSKRGLSNGNDALEKDTLLDATPPGQPAVKRTLSGASINSDDQPVARSSAPSRALSPKKKSDLDSHSKSEHIPKRRGQRPILAGGNDSAAEIGSSGEDQNMPKPKGYIRSNSHGSVGSAERPRRPRMGKTTSERNLSPRRPNRPSKTDSDADEKEATPNDLGASEHKRRRPRDHRADKSGEGRKKSDEPNADSEDANDEEKKERRRRVDRSLSARRIRSGEEAEGDTEKHSKRGDHERRRARRPEEEGKRSPGRKPSGRTRDHGEGGEEDEGKRSPGRKPSGRARDHGEGGEEEEGKRSPGRKPSGRTRDHGEGEGEEASRTADGRQRKPRRRRDEHDKSDGDLSPDDSSRRTRTPAEEGERIKGRRGRKGDGVQSRSASPTRKQNPRAKKTVARNQNDIVRNQYANMVKYADELDHEEEEEEQKEPEPEEEEPAPEEAPEEDADQHKKKGGGLFKSAFGAVAKTAKQGASLATQTVSTTTKLGVKVASQTTKIAVSTATEGVNITAKVAMSTGKVVSDSLGVGSTHHGKAKEDYLNSNDYDDAKRNLQPAPSISALSGGVLGGSSSAFMSDFDGDEFAGDLDDSSDRK